MGRHKFRASFRLSHPDNMLEFQACNTQKKALRDILQSTAINAYANERKTSEVPPLNQRLLTALQTTLARNQFTRAMDMKFPESYGQLYFPDNCILKLVSDFLIT